MSGERRATHAGTWYTAEPGSLDKAITSWLESVRNHKHGMRTSSVEQPIIAQAPLVQDSKAIIAPHAGYRFSGRTAAWAYACVNPDNVRRIVLLGPSHHKAMSDCELSGFASLETPLGSLSVDVEVVKQLLRSKNFHTMTALEDEAEHSLEMHLPLIRKVFENRDVKVVPIMVGQLNKSKIKRYAEELAPYVAQPDTMMIVSSDFCHWGPHFHYMRYQESELTDAFNLGMGFLPPQGSTPIYESIRRLDEDGMRAISYGDSGFLIPNENAAAAFHAFHSYIDRTHNTVCGRVPISLMLAIMSQLQEQGYNSLCRFTHYDQSSHCKTVVDNSVSYATAYVIRSA